MDVFISADMEGVTGVAAPADVVNGEADYARGVDRLHGDVNAAVEGAIQGGAETVLVNDAHATMRNLDPERLDGRATLIRGNTKPRSMMQGLTAEHDVALFVGYHAKAGTAEAVLNHTVFGEVLQSLHVENGESGSPDGDGSSTDRTEVGEMGWNARLAGALDVPVGLVTGDDGTVAEAREELPDSETVAVKEAIDRFSARCRPGTETRSAIREASERAVERAAAGTLSTVPVGGQTTIAAEWSTTNAAASAAAAPGVEREAGRRTAVTGGTYPDAFDASVGMLRAGGAGRDEHYG
jgi:D-amino peptidase